MKKKYLHNLFKSSSSLWIFGVLFLLMFYNAEAQVIKPFQQRTSSKAPGDFANQTIYNLRGDFKMIGNTNLTGSEVNNSNTSMTLVDLDGVSSTSNSSMAQLVLPANCTNIVYAGLYWSGRNNTTTGAITSTTNNYTSSSNIQSIGINVATTTTGTDSNGKIIYTLSNSDNSIYYQFTFGTDDVVQYRTSSSGSYTTIPQSQLSFSNTTGSTTGKRTVTLSQPFTFDVGPHSITVNNLQRRRSSSISNSDQRGINLTVVTNFGANSTKVKAKIRKGTSTYTSITADDFYIGGSDQDGIYTAYKDVTDYVRANGAGDYWVADLDLVAGNGGSVGYFGGWGMVIIYENPNMPWRDITVFDGYAYVSGGNSYNLPLSGFRAAQNGAVKVTMGMMAGEGDRGIPGDAFRIRNKANTQWIDLSHTLNATNNFFNSSILTDGSRNPNYENNTGIDIVKFDVTNNNNNIIGNSQTSTTFQYANNGSGGQDTFVIYNIVFAVDAYVPEVESVSKVSSANTVDINNLKENDEVTFTQEIYNYGSDMIDNGKVEITIPPSMKLISYSMTQNTQSVSGASQPFNFNNLKWVNPSTNAESSVQPATVEGGILRWTLGTVPTQTIVPVLANRKPLATLTYTLKVTNDCTILTSSKDGCMVRPVIEGKVSGVGRNSGENLNLNFVKGYDNDCNNTPIYGNISLKINPSASFLANCSINSPVQNGVRIFKKFCQATNNFIQRSEVIADYPLGTVFYSTLPTATSPTIVSGDFAVNTDGSLKMFYAVPPGSNLGCFYQLGTLLEIVTAQPTSTDVVACVGSTYTLPSATQNGLTLYYFTPGSNTPLVPFVSPTAAGVYNYEIALGSTQSNQTCYGPRKNFKITINPLPTFSNDEFPVICTYSSYTSTISVSNGTLAWEYWNGTSWVSYTNQLTGVSIVSNQLKITNALPALNNKKFRVKATSNTGCISYSSELLIKVKGCSMTVNPQIYIKQ